jgi:hypothetical protein
MMSRWFLLMSLLTSCGNGNKAAGDGDVDTNIVSIRVEPESADLVANLDAAAQMQFTAFATTDKGEEFETDMVTWETSNLSAGTIDETGLFTASVLNGGVTVVSATHVGIADEATITIIYEADIVGSGVDSALVNAFASASPSDGDLPALSYPLDGVNVPRNLEGLAFQWDLPDSANVVRIRMSTDITDIRIHVSGNDWMSNADLWSLIVASNTEGSVTVRIEAPDRASRSTVWTPEAACCTGSPGRTKPVLGGREPATLCASLLALRRPRFSGQLRIQMANVSGVTP